MSWLRSISRRRRRQQPSPDEWVFAADVVSSVTEEECRRLAELAAGKRVLELGSYWGRSTIAMASTAAVVHSVDPHNGGPPDEVDTLPRFLENLRRHGVRGKVVVHVGASTQVVPLFRAETFDLVFVDAAHQRPHVDNDLRLALACLGAGGAIAFHDYGTSGAFGHGGSWEPFGVKEAVEEFAALAGVEVETVGTTAVLFAPGRESSSERRLRWAEALSSYSGQF